MLIRSVLNYSILIGTLVAKEVPTIKEWSHLILAENMQVSILRISNINIDYDDANLFVSATLLDKTAYSGEFSYFNIIIMIKEIKE
jgi:hypothetical protein